MKYCVTKYNTSVIVLEQDVRGHAGLVVTVETALKKLCYTSPPSVLLAKLPLL
jgi:hypothetical protein